MLSEGSQSAHHLCFLYLFPTSLKIDLSQNIFSVVYSPQPTVMPLGLQSFLQCTHRLSDIISLILTLKSYYCIITYINITIVMNIPMSTNGSGIKYC